MKVFAFLDIDHMPTTWAVMRGMLVSASYVPGPSYAFTSFMLASLLENRRNDRIFNENIIESIREQYFPDKISRLRGMYFFRSRTEAESIIGSKDWPSYCADHNLEELELYAYKKPTIVDSNWITYAPLCTENRINSSNLDWVFKYWSGNPMPGKDPVWEIIADGFAIILNESIRRECHEILLEEFPHCYIIIELSRIANEVGLESGLIMPFLHRVDLNLFKLHYFIYVKEFHDKEKIVKMEQHINMRRLLYIISKSETWPTPDFGECAFSFAGSGLQPDQHENTSKFNDLHQRWRSVTLRLNHSK